MLLRICIGAALVFAGRCCWAAPLENAGFEAGSAGWVSHVYGPSPRVDTDESNARAGARSLKISATDPTDAAISQEVRLSPGRWYRASVWVKTEGLKARTASTLGALQVQAAGGSQILAAGDSHSGDCSWSETSLVFECPADGIVRFSLFLAGFGLGTGTVWFDEAQIEPVDTSRGRVTISATPLVDAAISPYQYGQFIEYLCDLVPSMWAEKLYDGSFEGLTPYKLVYLKETDFKERPWRPYGATNRAEYALDPADKISGDVSQRIVVPAGAPCRVGIAQDGLYLAKGEACEFRGWLRAEEGSPSIEVRIEKGRGVIASCTFAPKTSWQVYSAELVCPDGVQDGNLVIECQGSGKWWIDNVSLMPRNALAGWRPDVVEAVRALKPGIIRFGGSALDEPSLGQFEWTDTIGDPDRRTPFRAWGGLQPTGPGLEEIVQFCQAVGAEPFLCLRFTRRTAADAAAQVQYFNGPSDSPWGARRAKNGHPEPYRIKFWQVGNEVQSPEYDEHLAEFCRAMREADPMIEIASSFPSPKSMERAGHQLNFVAPHYYSPNLPQVERDLVALGESMARHAPGQNLKVAVSEWNTTAGDAGPRRAMLWTLANALACARFHHIWHRHADLVEITNRSNLINSFCSGIIQVDRQRLYKTPTYYAQWMYANLAGTKPLAIERDLPAGAPPDFSATGSADGRRVILFAVNDTLAPLKRTLDFSAFGAQAQTMTVWTLADGRSAGEPDVANDFFDPERVAARRSRFEAAGSVFDYCFPPLSLSALEWQTP